MKLLLARDFAPVQYPAHDLLFQLLHARPPPLQSLKPTTQALYMHLYWYGIADELWGGDAVTKVFHVSLHRFQRLQRGDYMRTRTVTVPTHASEQREVFVHSIEFASVTT